jgi:hypothetical protein
MPAEAGDGGLYYKEERGRRFGSLVKTAPTFDIGARL